MVWPVGFSLKCVVWCHCIYSTKHSMWFGFSLHCVSQSLHLWFSFPYRICADFFYICIAHYLMWEGWRVRWALMISNRNRTLWQGQRIPSGRLWSPIAIDKYHLGDGGLVYSLVACPALVNRSVEEPFLFAMVDWVRVDFIVWPYSYRARHTSLVSQHKRSRHE